MKIPIFAHGTYEKTLDAIEKGIIAYPTYIWIDDLDIFSFLNKDGELETCSVPKLVGTSEDEVILSYLDDGLYQIKGNHKVTANEETEFTDESYIFYVIQIIDEQKRIRRIDAKKITTYTIEEDLTVTENVVVTAEYLDENGYIAEAELEEVKREIEEEIFEYIDEYIDGKVEPVVIEQINNNILGIRTEDIEYLFS